MRSIEYQDQLSMHHQQYRDTNDECLHSNQCAPAREGANGASINFEFQLVPIPNT